MTIRNMIEAINDAHRVTMAADDTIVVFGEDVGYFGGVFRATAGLQQQFGKTRCFDAPISEGGIIGTAIGMAAYGLRPVVEIQFADYIYPGYDQIVSEVAKMRYRTAGEWTMPMVIRIALWRRHFRRADAQPVARGAVHPRRRDQDGDPVQPA